MQMRGGPGWPLRAYTAENIYLFFLDWHLQEHTKGKHTTHKNPRLFQKVNTHARTPRTRFVICQRLIIQVTPFTTSLSAVLRVINQTRFKAITQ